ncbi:hypothetical protein BGZ83_007430 [Gryganskiella cystojenkinii]|nr:hypothetical protein BGZ83_007430 [Gryganskiella cystojenkinii]
MRTRRQQQRQPHQENEHEELAQEQTASPPNGTIVTVLKPGTDDKDGVVINNLDVAIPDAVKSTAEKRTKEASTVPPAKFQKVEVPHAATLPQVVWVRDHHNFWWPGKIQPYPPKNSLARVSRFGNIKPKTLTVECTETNIISFEHVSKDSHRQYGKKSTQSQVFLAAFDEATKAQTKDDDDLPSPDHIFDLMPRARPKTSLPKDGHVPSGVGQRKQIKTGNKLDARTDLSIPGELVLATDGRAYFPARLISFNQNSNKYKVEYASGHSTSIDRKKFYTRYEKGFQTCPLGEMAMPTLSDNYREPGLESCVVDLYPALYAIVAGCKDEAGRLEAFLKGGKSKLALARRVGPGSFNRAQYALIDSMLQAEFLPDLCTTKSLDFTTRQSVRIDVSKEPPKARPASHSVNSSTKQEDGQSSDIPMKRDGDVTRTFSDQMRLHFVKDVLLPETIARLTMKKDGLTFEEAERGIQSGIRDDATDTWWVDDVLAARESFLEGGSQ